MFTVTCENMRSKRCFSVTVLARPSAWAPLSPAWNFFFHSGVFSVACWTVRRALTIFSTSVSPVASSQRPVKSFGATFLNFFLPSFFILGGSWRPLATSATSAKYWRRFSFLPTRSLGVALPRRAVMVERRRCGFGLRSGRKSLPLREPARLVSSGSPKLFWARIFIATFWYAKLTSGFSQTSRRSETICFIEALHESVTACSLYT
mmetsp:Transcript_16582/g.38757  ORF Transcript_16582/g.38757 Transcript_16582/m.38757 type:complete len:206 (+) Transcript_16582:3538-4155(+)